MWIPRRDDRGQAHTLEAFVAAMLLVAGLTFALQATAVTPLSASTSNQHIENQQRAAATDLLETSAANGDLREAVLDWHPGNATTDPPGFDPRSEERTYYSEGGPPNAFGDALDRAFLERRIAFNVHVYYHVDSTGYDDAPVKRQDMVYMGTPSDNAVTARRTVTVSNDTTLSASGFEDRTLSAVASDPDEAFYAPPVDDGPTYNHLEVRITTWRM
ncbi:hypothetical protein DQW50_07485 [Halorubrum sp. 48-1-W]|uniref:DUF7288 family protein n=1 Tax=Halorubrum sp. 48-1-W TaxID=2249761 RepID=UPI000DCB8C50|nr:hypothetical protein [Halorubrum sp. 48-1-W]RAW45735.1 hypothetical protein DQW50_07485 [Halorubrum sp. 48-1-W]